jgi:hypothetical protein
MFVLSWFRKRSASFWVLLIVALYQMWQMDLHKAYKTSNHLKWPMISDGLGYYVYLPAAIKYQDWSYSFVPEGISGSNEFSNTTSPKTGFRVNKYPIGVAILQLPFFGIGEIDAWMRDRAKDGFSRSYRYWMIMGAFFYQILGLVLIRGFLQFYFKERTIAVVLFCLALGTNLFYYSLHEGMMSHVYSFFLIAAGTYFTIKWHREEKLGQLLALAACCGMIFLVRPVNVLFITFFLLWGLGEKYGWQKKQKLLWRNRIQLIWGALLGSAIVSLQFLTWKLLTGSWFFFSYEGEGFLWTEPAIADVLWSYRKGWWVWTPLAFFMCLGLFTFYKKIPAAKFALPIYFFLHLYLISCWWSWWYGGSFGMRTMIEIMPVMSIALASFGVFIWKKGIPSWLIGLVIAFLIVLNVFQTYQKKRGYIHYDSMSKEAYWALFGKIELNEEERLEIKKLLIPTPQDRRDRLQQD